MSFTQLKTPGRELAVRTYSLTKLPRYLERIQALGAMYPCLKNEAFRFRHQALAMLVQLCDFDTRQVLHEVASLASNPNPPESVSDPCNGFRRLWRCKYPFRNYHYLIAFSRTGDAGITIEDILFDENRTTLAVAASLQRNLLYHVSSSGAPVRYRDVKSKDELESIRLSWGKFSPETQIRTRHAAVNGMQNDLGKARWLMGTHLDVAYPDNNIREYINPFDLVPNLAGHNDLSESGLMRSLRFLRRVFGENDGNPSVSPHTLPYLGVCTYYLQLKDAGRHDDAGVVYDYMSGLDDKQLAYERSLGDPNAHVLITIPKSKNAMV